MEQPYPYALQREGKENNERCDIKCEMHIINEIKIYTKEARRLGFYG